MAACIVRGWVLQGLLLLVLLAGCGPMGPEQVFCRVDVGEGILELRAEESVAPAAFSSQVVRFYLVGSDSRVFLATTRIANDGANLGVENCWVEPGEAGQWRITLRGSEQADEVWLLELDPMPQLSRMVESL